MKRKWVCALLSMFFPLTVMAALTTVTPKALTGPLTNPGIGVASFHQGYGETLGLADYPNTGFEYERFYWRDLEPVEGQYNFALVDDAFKYAAAHRPAMNVGLRFMALAEPESGSQIPDWLIKKGVKGTWTPDKKTFAPDLDDPLFIQYSQRLLNAFGKRYDGNENLAFVDIGMVGALFCFSGDAKNHVDKQRTKSGECGGSWGRVACGLLGGPARIFGHLEPYG